jgi:hypothetical protein
MGPLLRKEEVLAVIREVQSLLRPPSASDGESVDEPSTPRS